MVWLPVLLGDDALPLPLMLPDAPPEGDVVLLGVDDEDDELEPVVSDERGVVAVPGEADGLVRSGAVPPTRSDSVRLQAASVPPASARAQRTESTFFIADAPP